MNPDPHAVFRKMIDEALVAGSSTQQDATLRAHLQSCTPCQEYLDASSRVIEGLDGFSFPISPGLFRDVSAALELRAQQLASTSLRRRRLVWACILATFLTIAGSAADLQFGNILSSVFHLPSHAVRWDLLIFWISPSLVLLLLFPLLPHLAVRKERPL